jgi:hypothetical protein
VGGLVALGTASLTGTPGTLELLSLGGITATQLRFGAVTVPGTATPVTTAGSIAIAGTFNALGAGMELDTTGDITQSVPAPLLNVATLSGSGAAWSLTDPNNTIATIGNVTAAGFALTDSIGLSVTGALISTAAVTIADTAAGGTLNVPGTVSAPTIALSAGNIGITGLVSATGAVDLVANSGTINETGTLTAGLLFGGAVGVADLLGATPTTNRVGTIGAPGIIGTNFTPRNFVASSVALENGTDLAVSGSVIANGILGQVYLSTPAGTGITVSATGSVQATAGTLSFLTDNLVINSQVSATTIELAPATPGATITVGAAGGLQVPATGFNFSILTLGAVTTPTGGTRLTTAGAIAIDGPYAFTGGVLDLEASSATATGASGAVTQTVPLTGIGSLRGTADSITLTDPGNAIGDINNLTATAGDLSIVSTNALFPSAVAAPAGNVFLATSNPTGVIILGPVTARGRVSIQTDSVGADGGSVTANTFELAPFTVGSTVTLGAIGKGLSLPSLEGVFTLTASTARIGAVTQPSAASPTTRAGAITIAGTFDGTAVPTLELDAAAISGGTGAITQSAPLTNVATLAVTGASVALTNTSNTIANTIGITAATGAVTLVDGESLTLNGPLSGSNLFVEVAAAGGTITVGGGSAATLSVGAGGRISLVADGATSNVAGSIGTPGGIVELAPFSPIPVSLGGTGGGGTMPITQALLGDIAVGGGTLVVGAFSNPLRGGASTTTASAISLDGAVNLAGKAGTLVLLANGAVTEPAGPLTVGTVTGASVGDFSLNNPANNIQASIGITAAGGDVVLVDDPTLTITGSHSGTNLFFEVTQAGDSLQIGTPGNPATLTASTGGSISLVADSLAETAASTISAPLGTLAVAPFSAINESVLGTNGTGQLLVDSTLLSDITGALASLVIGEFTTPRIAAPRVSAASVTIDNALNLTGIATTLGMFAIGSVSQPGGAITVANLTGGAGTGFALNNTANAITQASNIAVTNGNLSLVDGISLTLSGSQSATNTFIEVASAGGALHLGGGFIPDLLSTATGGRLSLVADTITTNGTSTISAPVGTLELAPFSAINTSLLGSAGGQLIVSQALLSSVTPGLATLTVGGFTNAPVGATTPAASAASVTIDGTVTLGALASTLNLMATGSVTQAAPLKGVGTLSATGSAVTLTNVGNTITSASGITASAGDIAVVDSTSLALNGAYSGTNLFFEVASAGGTLTVGASGPATLTAGAAARISLVADNLIANTTGSIGNAGGTVELAPFSAIPVSLAGIANTGTMLISGGLLSNISVGAGTLKVGAFTNPAGATTTSAGAISLDGAVNLAGKAGTLILQANGPITEPGGPLTVGTVTGAAVGDFALENVANNIQASTGITAVGGNLALATDSTLTITGAHSGATLFFEATQAGGSLQIGSGGSPATLAASQVGRISLVADSITETTTSTLSAPGGTLEVAPFSAINESLLGTNGAGQLLVDKILLSDITGGPLASLVIGSFTFPRISISQVSAASVTVDGAVNLTGTAATLGLFANGAISEPGGPITVGTITGGAGSSFALNNKANAIAQAADISVTNGNLSLVDGTSIVLTGSQVAANAFFEVATAGGILSLGGTTQPDFLGTASGGRMSLVADTITTNGASAITSAGGTLELAPFSAINASLLGTSSGQLIVSQALLSSITLNLATLTVGGFTNVPAGATAPTASAASVTIDNTFSLGSLASTLNLMASGSVTQSAPILGVGTLTATGSAVTLTNAGNTIASGSGITATAGDISVVDATSLALNGAYSGTNLFFEVASAGGTLTVGASGPATLTAGAGARISLVADNLTANTTGSIGSAGGTVELAPFSAIPVSLAGIANTGTMLISSGLLGNINVGSGTLTVGAFTNPAGGTTTSAGAISLDGVVNLAGKAGTLILQAGGPITEPGGPLTVGTVTGAAVGDFSLNNAANNIQASTGMIAAGGNVVLLDDPTLLLTGPYTGTNLFFEVTQAGGSLQIGATGSPATLTASAGGRISLIADSLAETATSTLSAPGGTLEVAPFSAINESVLGTNGTGQLLVDSTLLSDITGGALASLVIGEFTTPRTVVPTISAANVTVDGALNLTGTAATLGLFAIGAVSEPGGPIAVGTVTGTAGTGFALNNGSNAIAQATGISVATGNLSLVDGISLVLTGSQSAANTFIEVAAAGGTLSLGGTFLPDFLSTTTGGRLSLVADSITTNGTSTISAPLGTLELAPFSAINTSLLGTAGGQLIVSQVLLSSVTPGLATLTVGGFTNVPVGATTPAASAASVTIDSTVTVAPLASALNLMATGSVTQSAPIVAVGVLTASGSAVTLTNAGNTIASASGITATAGDISVVDATSLALNGAYSGTNLFFEVATAGGTLTVGAAGPATLTAGAGARISLVADNLTANTTGSIGSAGGTVELAPFSAIPVSMAGTAAAGTMLISTALLSDINVGAGTLKVGAFTNPSGGGTTSAGAISLDGAVNLAGKAGTLILQANGPITEAGGPLTVGTVTGAAVGDFTLDNAKNNVQASTGMTAAGGNVVLLDDPTLLLTGPYTGTNLFFEVTLPGGSIGVGAVGSPATLTATTGGRISLVADGITANSASTITAPAGVLEVAPFSTINESVAGTNGSGQLLADGTLIGDITKGLATLVIGEYTPPRATTPIVSAANITVDGPVNLSGTVSTLVLIANGSVSEPGGPISVSNISGTASTGFTLANPANAIAQAQAITVTKGDLTLVDGTSLTLVAGQTANNAFIEVAAPGGVLQLGSGGVPDSITVATGGRLSFVADRITEGAANAISAAKGTMEIAPFSAINTSLSGAGAGQLIIDQTLLASVTPGLALLTVGGFTNVPGGATTSAPSAASISVDGAVTIGALATTLNFESLGGVTQSAPIQNVATLIGTTGATTLTNPNNSVAVLGNYSATNGFALSSATNLLLAGTLNAGPTATVVVAGTLTETGAINAGTLSGAASGNATLTGTNSIGGLNGFTVSGASGAFTLNDTRDLTITGTLSANRIAIANPASLITLGNGAAIVTGGTARPAGTAPPASLLPGNGAPGAFFQAAQFAQVGRATVTGLTGGPTVLQISVTGNARFDATSGLSGPGTWLVLNLTNGFASGTVAVAALDVSYTVPGGANLFGSIAGFGGAPAASLGFAQPQPDPRYLFNGCEIGIVSCQLATAEARQIPPLTQTVVFIPIDALLALVSPALVLDPEDNDDLLQMPVVSKQDY